MSSHVETPSMLFLGASGQTGGAFLTVFRKRYPDLPITVFLRSTALDSALTALGNVSIVHGTFDDLSTVEQLSATHPIIINCASSLFPPLTEAILRGIRARKAPQKPILIHLSGAGNFVDNSTTGNYVSKEHHWNDANVDDVRSITAETLPNGPCDELIFKAAAAGDVNALFVCPGGIYGASAHHVAQNAGPAGASYASALGVWVAWMVQNIKTLGFSPYVGEGTSVFRVVHVDDVVDLMMLVFQKALDTWETYKPEDVFRHFYLGVGEGFAAKPLATAFAEMLYRTGQLAEPAVKSVPYEEAGIVARYLAGNMLVEDDNSKALGWKPKAPGMLQVLKEMR